jgi:antitoxin MazE
MVKRFTKAGNSYALVVERAVMDLLNITPDTPMKMSTDGDEIRFKPLRGCVTEQQVDESLDRFYKKYGRMMKRLAE